MATRSTIWRKNEDGSFTGVYCHWDGYLEGVGVKLKKHYTDDEKVKGLIALGSISSLEESIDCPSGHSFENPVEGYTIAYHRDRDEDLNIYHVGNYDEAKKYFEEYNYFFINGAWQVSEYGNKLKTF